MLSRECTLIYAQPYLTWAFFEPSVMGAGGMRAPHHNFVVIAPMIIKFGTDVKRDVVYTMVTKKFVTSLLRHYDVYENNWVVLNFCFKNK